MSTARGPRVKPAPGGTRGSRPGRLRRAWHVLGPGLVAGAAITALILLGGFGKIQQVFKVLCLVLLSYVVVLFVARVPWRTVAVNTVLPHVTWSKDYLALLVAVLGTTISPYLFFWQTANRVEEMRLEDAGGAKPYRWRAAPPSARRARPAAAASTCSPACSCPTWSCSPSSPPPPPPWACTAARTSPARPRPQAPSNRPPGAWPRSCSPWGSSAPGRSPSRSWPTPAPRAWPDCSTNPGACPGPTATRPLFYILITAGTLGGTGLTLSPVNPITLLVLVAGVNGIAAAPFLIVVMIISGNRHLMGDSRNGALAAVLGWFTVALMTAAAIAMLALLTGL